MGEGRLRAFDDGLPGGPQGVPSAMRAKLDLTGAELSKAQWDSFSRDEREDLLRQACRTPDEIAAYRGHLQQLVATRAGEAMRRPHEPATWAAEQPRVPVRPAVLDTRIDTGSAAVVLDGLRVTSARQAPHRRLAPEEAPVALVHDGSTTAVMMATPADLEDFALGFSLTEGLIHRLDEVEALEVVAGEAGVEARMWLAADRRRELVARRRRLAGPTGCGLCGVESLHEAARPPRRVGEGFRIARGEIHQGLAAMTEAQSLGSATRAVHAAACWSHDGGLSAVREDVGRHNALDKLAGALARRPPASAGAVILTSRVSVEMVQKTAAIGAQVLVAVSAPTALAVRTAEAAGMTLVAVAREDGFEVFTRPDRIA